MQLTVGIITSAHGLKGEVKIDVRTDSPQLRFYEGAILETDPAELGPLVIRNVREYKGMTYLRFNDITDRNAAESLRGTKLIIESDEADIEEDAWYPHELIGLEVLDTEGYELGTVLNLQPMPAQDLLVVKEPDGRVVSVPFVRQIVTEIDLADNCVVLDPPPGLFSEDEIIIVEGNEE